MVVAKNLSSIYWAVLIWSCFDSWSVLWDLWPSYLCTYL